MSSPPTDSGDLEASDQRGQDTWCKILCSCTNCKDVRVDDVDMEAIEVYRSQKTANIIFYSEMKPVNSEATTAATATDAVMESGDLASHEPSFGYTRSYEIFNPMAISRSLEIAQTDSRRLRRWISGPPLVAGLLLNTCSMTLMVINLSIFSPALFNLCTVMFLLGAGLSLMSTMPTDHIQIRITSVAFFATAVLGSGMLFYVVSSILRNTDCWASHVPSQRIVLTGTGLLVFSLTIAVRALRGCCILRSRPLLLLEWRLFAEFNVVWGIGCFFIALIDFLASAGVVDVFIRADLAPESARNFEPWWPMTASCGALLAAFGLIMMQRSWPFMPQCVFVCLASSVDSLSSAACIAGTFGNKNIKSVVKQAQERCMSIPLNRLRKSHMATNRAGDCLAFRKLAQPTCLGDIDVFISHSWHDDADAKWEALQTWRQQFTKNFHREPCCWIDKMCIDQTNIKEDLMCLPVYLAGSRGLLILLGPTYLQRLWCVLELLVFLLMGGKRENIFIQKVRGVEEEAAGELCDRLQNFSVHDCQCVNPGDKDMILSVVEAGFQDIDDFNFMVTDLIGANFPGQTKSDSGP